MATLFVTTTVDNVAGSLRSQIAAAQPGDTIAFALPAGSTIALTAGQIDIPAGKNLIIDGSGTPNLTISGSGVSRIFSINANVVTPTSVTISNLTLSDAYTSGRGAAIVTSDEVSLTINNVTFRNNTADQGGGGIFAGWNSDVDVSNSRFENNIAIAANDERGAGAIAFLSPGTLRVSNSDFIGNRGINGAAINSLNGKLTIENSRFIGNDTLAATYATFDPNGNNFLRGFGGAVYTDRASSTNETAGTIRISGSVFENNQGRGEGGAAYLFTAAGQDNVIIENTRFVGNAINPLPGGNNGNGGAVNIISNGFNNGVLIQNTTFANNSATGQGGGLWMYDAPATIVNSTFSGNQTGGAGDIWGQVGGGITLYNAPTNIINTTFANNNANWVGGAFSSGGAAVTLTNSLFYNNTSDNQFQIQQHAAGTNLIDGGGNLQFPAKLTNFFNDYNVLPGITIADPLLQPLQLVNGALVHPLSAGSPAIDTGVATAFGTDQSGAPRPQDGDLNGSNLPDIGSVEAPGTALPEIVVLDGATNVLDGSTIPIAFGTVLQGGLLTRTFAIANIGTAALDLTNLTLPTGFSLAGALPASLAPGTFTNLIVQVNTATAGTFTGTFNLANNDSDENPFNFAIQAIVQAPAPEIAILDGATNLVDGTVLPLDLGTVLQGGTLTRTFTVSNQGTAALDLTNLTLPTGFSLAGSLPTSLAAGASTNLTVQVNTATAGTFTGTFNLTNNDSDENPFDFAIQAIVQAPAPEIALLDGATNLVDGTVSPLDFGTVLQGGTLTRTFTVANQGTGVLNLSGLMLPTGFNLVGTLPTSLAVGASTNLVIEVDTTTAGIFSGVFNLANDDSDESPFNFVLTTRVKGPNTNPLVTAPLLDQLTTATAPFQYIIAANTFTDADIDPLTLSATLTGGTALPTWLAFNPVTGIFSGTPTAGDIGTLSIDLTANDGFGGVVTDTFLLTINPVPIAPIQGTNESETLVGTIARDRIFGWEGHDILSGWADDDDIWGGGGNDRLYGGDGNDTLYGEAGADQLHGDAGNDWLAGGEGDDLLYGGDGNDFLHGGLGNDQLLGGAGQDTIALFRGEGIDLIRDFRVGEDVIGLGGGLTFGTVTVSQRLNQTWIRDHATAQVLARLDGVNAATLIANAATSFIQV